MRVCHASAIKSRVIAFSLPARAYRVGALLAQGRDEEQLPHVNGERFRQSLKDVYRDIEALVFDFTDRGSINLSIKGQCFLRQAFGRPKASKVPCDTCAPVHGREAISLLCSNLSDISDINMRGRISVTACSYALKSRVAEQMNSEKTGIHVQGELSSAFASCRKACWCLCGWVNGI